MLDLIPLGPRTLSRCHKLHSGRFKRDICVLKLETKNQNNFIKMSMCTYKIFSKRTCFLIDYLDALFLEALFKCAPYRENRQWKPLNYFKENFISFHSFNPPPVFWRQIKCGSWGVAGEWFCSESTWKRGDKGAMGWRRRWLGFHVLYHRNQDKMQREQRKATAPSAEVRQGCRSLDICARPSWTVPIVRPTLVQQSSRHAPRVV